MTTRDDLILSHIGLYRLSLRRTLERLFFNGKAVACDNVLRRLIADGRVQCVKGLPHRISYYQLTRAEALRRGLPPNRAGRLRAQALQQHLGVLWFCCMGPTPRVRLEPSQLERINAGLPAWPQVCHCAERGDKPTLYRVVVLGPQARPFDLLARLSKQLSAEQDHPELGALARTGFRAVAILADQPARVAAIEAAIKRRRLRDLSPTIVEFAPSVQTLASALHEFHK